MTTTKATQHDLSECPMDAILRVLMGQWTAYILWILQNNGPTRFGELKRQIVGVSSKVLTERLRMLEERKIIYREVKPTSPPEVTYGLTGRGDEVMAILKPLYDLSCRWIEEDRKQPG